MSEICRYLKIFTAVCLEMNSASLEIMVVSDSVLDLQTMVLPQKVWTIPVVDNCFWNQLTWAASKNPIRVYWLMLTSKVTNWSSWISYYSNGWQSGLFRDLWQQK